MTDQRKKILRILGLVGLFLVSFSFFLYLTFPYEVLKEAISSEISKSTGMHLRIGELSPNLPLGMDAEDVTLQPRGAASTLRMQSVSVEIGLLSLLIGRLSVNLTVEDASKGELYLHASLGLLSLMSGSFIPKVVEMESTNFAVDDIVSFLLSTEANSPDVNPLLGPMLAQIVFQGKLNGEIEMNLDAGNPTQSEGRIDIRLDKATLKFNDPSLAFLDQNFSKAQIKAQLEGGALAIDKTSEFMSKELFLGANGKITLKPDLMASLFDMKVTVRIEGGLKSQFDFILNALAGGSRDGKVTVELKGPLGRPNTNFL